MFTSWSLNKKMIGAFAACATMLLLVGGINYHTLHEVSTKYRKVATANLPDVIEIADMRAFARRVQVIVLRMGLDNASAAEIAELKKEGMEDFEKYEKAEKAYLAIDFMPGEEALYNAENEEWKMAKAAATKLFAIAGATGPNAKAEYYRLFESEFWPHSQNQLGKFLEIVKFHNADSKKSVEEAEAASSSGMTISVIAISLGFFTALAAGFLFSRSLSKRLGDLASQLGEGADLVASASQQISGAGAELSASATEQAAALQETVASVDEISAMISKNADNAKKSQQVSAQSHETATKGKQTVDQMIESINEINRSNSDIMTQIETSNREISEIVKVISEIGNKTKVINDIVFQTKLLSFNASVEAARAGEHGKGFAVVAEEVGNLAQMSGNAAKEISQMLEGSIQKVEGIVNDTKVKVERLVVTGKAKVETGQATAKQCGQVLDEIVNNVSEVNQMINEIATASHEQSQGVQEITKAMSQLDQVTQQNASASEQSSAAAEQLTKQAQDLNHMVGTLTETINGAGSNTGHVKATTRTAHATKNIVEIKKRPSKKFAADEDKFEVRAKKVSGSDVIPSESDPRFEDI